ncbi:MAG: hypothetical protein C0501_03425 [Isosphaera sp.]|nr:hypothetical protein [Isosphaera sp.]
MPNRSTAPPPRGGKDSTRLFEAFGVVPVERTRGLENVQAESCPSCGGAKFSFDRWTSQFQYSSLNKCGLKGNGLTLMR